MPPRLTRPYRRIFRPGVGLGDYQLDPRYAANRVESIHALKVLERDLVLLLDYVAPRNDNLAVYSQRCFELLLRAATEVEANLTAILRANDYPGSRWDMTDYQKVEDATRLSEYEIRFNLWEGDGRAFSPFASWARGEPLKWYSDYNKVTHDRGERFALANLKNVLEAVCGLAVVLYAQFEIQAFQSTTVVYSHLGDDDGWVAHDHSVFAIRPPRSWQEDDRYGFKWEELEGLDNPFVSFPFR